MEVKQITKKEAETFIIKLIQTFYKDKIIVRIYSSLIKCSERYHSPIIFSIMPSNLESEVLYFRVSD